MVPGTLDNFFVKFTEHTCSKEDASGMPEFSESSAVKFDSRILSLGPKGGAVLSKNKNYNQSFRYFCNVVDSIRKQLRQILSRSKPAIRLHDIMLAANLSLDSPRIGVHLRMDDYMMMQRVDYSKIPGYLLRSFEHFSQKLKVRPIFLIFCHEGNNPESRPFRCVDMTTKVRKHGHLIVMITDNGPHKLASPADDLAWCDGAIVTTGTFG